MQGVKGLLEQAGYTVYNPTLPYHNPMQAWNPTDGIVAVQTYVDVFKKVSAFADIRAGINDRGPCIAGDTRKVSPYTLRMMADHNTSTSMSVITFVSSFSTLESGSRALEMLVLTERKLL